MENAFDVSDPTDWLPTPVAALAPVENALRCQVCKDFFTTPVITSCSHTFCSLCIRRCLTSEGKCPTCRTPDQELRLRPNWIVQELVDSFQAARGEILQLGRDVKAWKEQPERNSRKRKAQEIESESAAPSRPASRRRTRSQNVSGGDSARPVETDGTSEEDDGLAACPICNKRMKEEEVFPHLDVHDSASERASQAKATNTANRNRNKEVTLQPRVQSKAMQRLPQLTYSLLSDSALRKKLEGLGIPNNGPRALLMKRHTEWVNLVNSNCDSKTPRSKRDLLHELDIWERSQGRQIQNGGNTSNSTSSIMDKEFDGAAWASKHGNDFLKLIAQAKTRKKPPPKADPADDEDPGTDPTARQVDNSTDDDCSVPNGLDGEVVGEEGNRIAVEEGIGREGADAAPIMIDE